MKKQSAQVKKENIEKMIAEKNKLPKEVKDKINSKVFVNVVFAVVIMVYLGALNLGMGNIPTDNYLTDLKVFGMLILVRNDNCFRNCVQKGKGRPMATWC